MSYWKKREEKERKKIKKKGEEVKITFRGLRVCDGWYTTVQRFTIVYRAIKEVCGLAMRTVFAKISERQICWNMTRIR